MPKIVPKSLQTCFMVIFSKKNYAQCSMEGRVFEKFQKKIFSKFQKCPKVFPNVSKRVLNMFWGKFFEKFYAQCSMEGRVFENFLKNQKFLKIPKKPKIVPKSIQTCFERVLGQTSRKLFAQFSTAGRILGNFQKNQKKNSKFQKRPQSFPKESKRVLIVIWDHFFEKFLPSFPWKVESSKIFKKKHFQNSKNAQKCSQKYPNVF